VQITYLAYCSSTGLETMDYRLTDPYLDPPEQGAARYVERSLYLESYWCYAPDVATPGVSALPARAAGRITFGCLNNFCKASRPALETWARLLAAVPHAQLLLHAPPGSPRQRVSGLLAAAGVDPARCTFAGKVSFDAYLRLYDRIDIALDPFPYAGGTTTCDALYMGVPVVTLAGSTAVGRSGVSLLSQLGVGEWIARDADHYVELAAGLAGAPDRLEKLRAGLRGRMEGSSLMDAGRFARAFQGVLRRVWRDWCAAGA
jgi:predicted O-linked N-acetylglucosamine transferase (SPINDLY family)